MKIGGRGGDMKILGKPRITVDAYAEVLGKYTKK